MKLIFLFCGMFILNTAFAQVNTLNEYRTFVKEVRWQRIASNYYSYQNTTRYSSRIRFNAYYIAANNNVSHAATVTRSRTYVESPKPNSLSLDKVSYYNSQREENMNSPFIHQVIAPIFYESIKVIGELNAKYSR
jgi:hypothetical protein